MALPKKPTELAKVFFDKGFDEALRARHALDATYTNDPHSRALFEIAQSLGSLCRGLTELSTGVRATYMAVESLGGTSDKPSGGMLSPNFMKDVIKGMQAQQAHAVQDAMVKVVRKIAEAGGNLASIAGISRP